MPDNSQLSLREGFSTGTAAAAAASAAVTLLLAGILPREAAVLLPPFAEDGTSLGFGNPSPLPRLLVIPIEQGERHADRGTATASVIKDGGDDPDVTHGARIIVQAGFQPPCPENTDTPLLGALPGGEILMRSRRILLYGGEGVGRITLPGLPVSVGEPAINPEPRKQIAVAACLAAEKAGYDGPLHLLLRVPDGEERALKTLNPRLGILGGISILGTSGTVRPYSHDAWKAAICQQLDIVRALGREEALFSTGRRSERMGLALYPELSGPASIQVADYAAFSLREAARRSFTKIIWVCFPGKLLKLAQGLEWTHAASAPADISLLAAYAREAGASDALLSSLASMPTVAGVMTLMENDAPGVSQKVLRSLTNRAAGCMCGWLNACAPSSLTLILHVFARDGVLSDRETVTKKLIDHSIV